MNETELEQRKARAASETLVISKTEGGFRVYNPTNITHLYMVNGIPESPKCNCADFETHQSDPEWRCKHILAVLNQMEKQRSEAAAAESPKAPQQNETSQAENQSPDKKKSRAPRNGHSQMLIKRSISPDGHIDSLSIEFMSPVDIEAAGLVKDQAQKALKLQTEIADEFLKANGNGKSKPNTQTNGRANGGDNPNDKSQSGANKPSNGSDGAVPAQLLNIAGMNTKGGWKTFVNVQVNDVTTKLFGSKRELGEHITAAGFASIADHISQGMMLNLPCRVITKRSPDGKYLNIEKVLPAKPLENNGKAGQ